MPTNTGAPSTAGAEPGTLRSILGSGEDKHERKGPGYQRQQWKKLAILLARATYQASEAWLTNHCKDLEAARARGREHWFELSLASSWPSDPELVTHG